MTISPIETQASMLEAMSQMQANAGIQTNSINEHSQKVDFSDVMSQAIRGIDHQQHDASAKIAAVESGRSDDLVGAMIAGQKASISFLALTEVRNRLMSGLEDLMRTQV